MTTDTQTLELVPSGEELPMKRADTIAIWSDFKTQAEKLKTTAETLTISDVNQVAEMKLARATRLALKELRVSVEHKRKELGEYHLKETQKINSAAKEIKELIEPLETLEQEQFVEREFLRICGEKRTSRTAELTPFLTAPCVVDLGAMTDADYASLLQATKDAHQAKLDREKKEKEAAESQAKAEAEERERIGLENERLKREAEEAKAEAPRLAAIVKAEAEAKVEIEREKAEKAARVAAAKAKKEREEIEAKAKADREAAAERAAKEAEFARKARETADAKAKSEREAAEDLARKERAAREKLEAELAAKKAAEEKAEAERKETERKAANAPAKEKLMAYAKEIRLLLLKTFDALKNSDVKEVSEQAEKFASWIEKKAGEL